MSTPHEVFFPKRWRQLPRGYRVVQLDSGHFLGIGPHDTVRDRCVETGINVDRYAVRRWCFAHSKESK